MPRQSRGILGPQDTFDLVAFSSMIRPMSGGHHLKHELTRSELDDLLDEALANPKVKLELSMPFKVITTKDIPLLGSSSVNRKNLYLDRHLRYRNWPYAVLPVEDGRLNVKPGLIRHERLEPILENVFGWPYAKIAHPVAQHYEERDYLWRGFDSKRVEKAFEPYIRKDEAEPLADVPTDLDLRPMLDDVKLLERTRAAQDAQKRTHESVGYVSVSKLPNQKCQLCAMFVSSKFGGPACVGVKSEIDPSGWCKRFKRGSLETS